MTYQSNNICPVLSSYAALHLNSITKVLQHLLFLNLVFEIFLFLLAGHYGGIVIFGSFCLLCVTVTVLCILNNHRMGILKGLSATQFNVGLATGMSILAAVLAAILSNLPLVVFCVHNGTSDAGSSGHQNSTASSTSASSETGVCEEGTGNAVYFWCGLSAWLHAITSMLLLLGQTELASDMIYDAVDTNNNNHDFAETFRKQQQEILGVQTANMLQNRANQMFVGDYANIPEVTQGGSANHRAYQQQQSYHTTTPQQQKSPPNVLNV